MQPLEPQVLPAPPAPETSGGSMPAPFDAPQPSGRRNGGHVVRFVLALIGWVGVVVGVMVLATFALTREIYGSVAARDADVARATSIGLLGSATFVLVSMGLIARLVGYRARDALFALVPVYSYVFQVKMLWRWTGLPDRPWDASSPTTEATAFEDVERRAVAPRRGLRPADPFIAIMLVLVLALVGFIGSSNPPGDDVTVAAAEGWRTVRARGMTIDVPSDWAVNTDPAEAAQMLAEAGDPGAAELGEVLTEFPDFFVLMAVEPTITDGSAISIFRFPSGGVPLRKSAARFASGAEAGGFELVAEEALTVGTGAYRAVRFDWQGGPPPPGPSIDFVIDDRPQIWTVGFVMPVGAHDEMTPVVARAMDSLTLP